MNFKVISKSPDDTFLVGRSIGAQLKGNEIIFMRGELGAGKTLLTKGISQSLGIDAGEVVSPTFTLMNEFQYEDGKLYHFDLYRLGPAPVTLPEIDDYMDEAVIIIEWAQYLHPSYFESAGSIEIDFQLSEQNDDYRTISIKSTLNYLSAEGL